MLRYLDFVPQQRRAPGLFHPGDHENFDQAVQAANDWLASHAVKLINLETVVLPNIWSRWEEGSNDAALATGGDHPSHWHQVLRVWYIDEAPPYAADLTQTVTSAEGGSK